MTEVVGELGRVEVQRAERGFATSAESRFVKLIAREAARTAGSVSFGTEAPQLTALGAETVVFGPGSMTVAHTNAEFVPVAELERCADILVRVIAELNGD